MKSFILRKLVSITVFSFRRTGFFSPAPSFDFSDGIITINNKAKKVIGMKPGLVQTLSDKWQAGNI